MMVSSAILIRLTFRNIIHVAVDLEYHDQRYMTAGWPSKHAHSQIYRFSVLTIKGSQILFRKQELSFLRTDNSVGQENMKSPVTYREIRLGLKPFAVALPRVTSGYKFPSKRDAKQNNNDKFEKSEKTHFFLSGGVRFERFYCFASCNRFVACLLLFQPGGV